LDAFRKRDQSDVMPLVGLQSVLTVAESLIEIWSGGMPLPRLHAVPLRSIVKMQQAPAVNNHHPGSPYVKED